MNLEKNRILIKHEFIHTRIDLGWLCVKCINLGYLVILYVSYAANLEPQIWDHKLCCKCVNLDFIFRSAVNVWPPVNIHVSYAVKLGP